MAWPSSGLIGSWWRCYKFYEQGRNLSDEALVSVYRNVVALCDEDAPGEAARQLEAGICLRYCVEDYDFDELLTLLV